MLHIMKLAAALVLATLSTFATVPAAMGAPPAPQGLNPAPPEFYDCTTLGALTLCKGARHEVKVSEEQDLVCGTGQDAFFIHDNGAVDQRFTRWYDANGNLTKRVIEERWTETFWSNPLSGKTLPYTQTDKSTTELTVPGDLDSGVETIVGENLYTDPATHKKVFSSVGRMVFGSDGTPEFLAGQLNFIDAFLYGDWSAYDAMCAALA